MQKDTRVCFIGDSFVAGVGDPDHRGWAGRLASAVPGGPITSYNLGVRRQTTRDIEARWFVEAQARLPRGCDARVVFSCGVNDTTEEGGETRVERAESVSNLRSMTELAKRQGWQLWVVGPPPVFDELQNERTRMLDEDFAAMCEQQNIQYCSVFDDLRANELWMRQVAEGDGAHPGRGGYEVFTQLLTPTWLAWIEGSSATPAAGSGAQNLDGAADSV
ncbi:GDSL-type esterase/lipase family protein [Rhodococcus sp. OK302]|uniref:GDSL-type esterase/lipase family protein n=1 Tax=Rhodococcus sp. OK302 TaxID=1882769 RepID=UPI000B93E972|nr:GDSL-type esterase/lipase family protein [Rhodococcus sp. OK302]OYD66877.1 lysophospholipase L1-like esterase [Rhodococcus sp. OK302]